MEKNYTEINLPKTDFPMKGNLVKREPEIAKKWEEFDLYHKLLEKRKGRPTYILHDGPPYANGDIHMGHVLNKVLKDIVVRYKFFKNYFTPFVPGWDCHGMPIEHKVLEEIGTHKDKLSKIEIRKKCFDYAIHYVEVQKSQFKRLGIMGEWDNPYLTLDKKYEIKMLDIFQEMYKKGLVYKGLKPVYWCAKCETALADAEVEYKDHKTPSIYVKFKVKDFSKSKVKLPDNSYILIWTTTPWTLPANVAIALHPDFEYVRIKVDGENWILASDLLNNFISETKIKSFKEEEKFTGKEFEYVICEHPFIERDSIVILADYVTKETGTGCVHIAPGHGYEDYLYGLKYKLPILNPVDNKGKFTEEFLPLKGIFVFDANSEIIEILKEKNSLIYSADVIHSYPHCWRCKKPIIFRATNQWFISMEKNNFREKVLNEIKKVKWLNEWGEERIRKMVETRPDWCISRQRAWGVPIFVFYCKKCGNAIVNENTIEKIRQLLEKEGSDGWYKYSANEILLGLKCPDCGGSDFEKESDIFDVWFDSGASSFAVLENYEELSWPADLYLEGSDQYRGWFQSSLLTSVAYREKTPYRAVISTGWVVDGQGRAMHKSLGNVISPLTLIEKSGADILRLWVASEDFKVDLPVSDEIMSRITDAYRRIRNTFRYILGNLYDFDKNYMVQYENLTKLDKYVLSKLQNLIDDIEKYYENFEFYKVYRDFVKFCSSFLSSFYFDIIKDRLYTFKNDSTGRRAAQTVLYKLFIKLTKIIAPILVFTTDEVWQFAPEKLKDEQSIHLSLWDFDKENILSEKELNEWNVILKLRDVVLKKIEEKRNEKIIAHPYESNIEIYYSSKELDYIINKFKDELEAIFIVSKADYFPSANLEEKDWDYNLEVKVNKSKGEKCQRCWRYLESVGKNKDYPELCERCVKNI